MMPGPHNPKDPKPAPDAPSQRIEPDVAARTPELSDSGLPANPKQRGSVVIHREHTALNVLRVKEISIEQLSKLFDFFELPLGEKAANEIVDAVNDGSCRSTLTGNKIKADQIEGRLIVCEESLRFMPGERALEVTRGFYIDNLEFSTFKAGFDLDLETSAVPGRVNLSIVVNNMAGDEAQDEDEIISNTWAIAEKALAILSDKPFPQVFFAEPEEIDLDRGMLKLEINLDDRIVIEADVDPAVYEDIAPTIRFREDDSATDEQLQDSEIATVDAWMSVDEESHDSSGEQHLEAGAYRAPYIPSALVLDAALPIANRGPRESLVHRLISRLDQPKLAALKDAGLVGYLLQAASELDGGIDRERFNALVGSPDFGYLDCTRAYWIGGEEEEQRHRKVSDVGIPELEAWRQHEERQEQGSAAAFAPEYAEGYWCFALEGLKRNGKDYRFEIRSSEDVFDARDSERRLPHRQIAVVAVENEYVVSDRDQIQKTWDWFMSLLGEPGDDRLVEVERDHKETPAGEPETGLTRSYGMYHLNIEARRTEWSD